jgi:hypothetical protein
MYDYDGYIGIFLADVYRRLLMQNLCLPSPQMGREGE